jgi:hypothetical protein
MIIPLKRGNFGGSIRQEAAIATPVPKTEFDANRQLSTRNFTGIAPGRGALAADRPSTLCPV